MKSSIFTTALSLCVLSCVLAGCATTQTPKLTPTTCQTADWHAIGVADGKVGAYPQYISRHQKSCQSTALPNRKLWEEGRQEGLQSYCTSNNAYELGVRGYDFHSVCPDEMALELQQSYDLGYRQYYMRERLNHYNWYSPFYRPWFAPMSPYFYP